MVGGTIFHRRVIQREISRVLVLNLLWHDNAGGACAPPRITMSLTEPSLLSRGTHSFKRETEIKRKGRATRLVPICKCVHLDPLEESAITLPRPVSMAPIPAFLRLRKHRIEPLSQAVHLSNEVPIRTMNPPLMRNHEMIEGSKIQQWEPGTGVQDDLHQNS